MDPIDYNIDEEEINEREDIHTKLTIFIVTVVVIMIFYICLHIIASLFCEQFQLLNPICLLLGIELGLRNMNLFRPHIHRHSSDDFFLGTLMMTVAVVSFAIQFSIEPENSLNFSLQVLNSAFGSFIVTSSLSVVLII